MSTVPLNLKLCLQFFKLEIMSTDPFKRKPILNPCLVFIVFRSLGVNFSFFILILFYNVFKLYLKSEYKLIILLF